MWFRALGPLVVVDRDARRTSRCGTVRERLNFTSTNRCSSLTASGPAEESTTHPTATANYLRDTTLGARAIVTARRACCAPSASCAAAPAFTAQ
jgi:hypothetical protein